MSFPHSYQKIILLSDKSFNIKYIYHKINILSKEINIKNMAEEQNNIKFTSNNSLLHFEYDINFKIDESEEKLIIEVDTINLFKISILIVIVLPFISNFGIINLIFYAMAAAAAFYMANILYINRFINKITNFIIKDIEINKVQTEELSEQQLAWMSDSDLCPACGTLVLGYFQFCEECGLKLSRKAKPSPFNFTKYKDYQITYIYNSLIP